MPDLGGMILTDCRMLEAEAARSTHDSWDNPDWECDGWALDTRVGLAGIAGLDVQLDVLRGTIDQLSGTEV